MIVGLRGMVTKCEPMMIELDVGGVIYGVQMSLNATSKLRNENGKEVKIICTQIIREDAHLLFGFVEEIEKQTFERLIKINGVGPKVALAILSTYTPMEFAKIISNKDVDALKKVPGIGAKGAGKIMVDVAGFFASLINDENLADGKSLQENSLKNEALLALQSLGFKNADAQKALQGIEAQSVSELVKLALKKLA